MVTLLLLLPFGLGVTGGVPVTGFIRETSAGSRSGFGQIESAPRRYTIGPSVEWRWRRGLSLESGVFYKRFGLDTQTSGGSFNFPKVSTQSRTSGNAWETPVLVRSRLALARQISLTLGGGLGVRFLTGVHERGTRTATGFFNEPGRVDVTTFTSRRPDRSPMVGAVVDGGVEVPVAGSLRLSPRVRLTRWDSERTSRDEPSSVRFARFQAEVLMSLMWRGPVDASPFPEQLEVGVLLDASGGAGAFVDWRVRRFLSIEGSFLTERFGEERLFLVGQSQAFSKLSGRGWTAPLLLKLRPWRPVRRAALSIGAGPAYRRASDTLWLYGSPGFPFPLSVPVPARNRAGTMATAGLEIRMPGAIRLRPEVRWAWFADRLYRDETLRGARSQLRVACGFSWNRGGARN